MKRRRWAGLAWALCGVLLACGGDPEAGSGGDAYRSEAQPMPLDELVTDSLSRADSDRTDWRALQLDAPGRLLIEFSADVPKAKLFIALFDQYGTRLAGTKRPGGKISTLAVDVPRGGRYFLMVRAIDGPATAYSIQASVGDTPTQQNVPAGRPGF